MKKNKFTIPEEIISQILAIPPENLAARGLLNISPKKAKGNPTFDCPFCGNGKGEDGTGIEPFNQNGVWTFHCLKCGEKFNNFKIFSNYYNIPTYGKNFIELCKKICADFSIALDLDETIPPKNLAAIVKSDLFFAQMNIQNLSVEHRRALSFKTLEKYNIGVYFDWIHPNFRLEEDGGKNYTPTDRMIIPSFRNKSYDAVAFLAHRDKIPKKFWKMHTKPKEPFGLQFISDSTKFLVISEGEIDAMSIDQACNNQSITSIAIGGAAEKDFLKFLDSFFIGKPKPHTIILFDNDDAGRKAAPKLCEEMIWRGYPTVFDFLAESDSGIDANVILQRQDGNFELADLVLGIIKERGDDLDKIAIEIEQSEKVKAKQLILSPEQYNKIFRDIHGVFDLDNAERLAYLLKNVLGDTIRYMSDLDRWANYDAITGIWKVNSNSNNTALTPQVKQVADILTANSKSETDSYIANLYKKQRKISPAVSLMKYHDSITISTQDLDTHKNLLNVENGVIDLQTGNFYQHAPIVYHNGQPSYFAQMAKAQWRGLDFRSEFVEKTLKEILPDDDDRHAFLMWMAYGFTGESNEEKFLFMDGDGGNGKGTLTKVWLYIANSYGVSFPVEAVALTNKFDANAPTPALTMLEKARSAISEEIPQGMPLNQAKIKQLTGGDPIPVMPKFQEYHVIQNPTHTLILSGNHLPELGDAKDAGIIRRLRRIKFEQNFRDNPNLQLKKELLTDENRSAWLALIVKHSIEWYKFGLPTSSNMQKAADDYFKSQDFIGSFIDDFCTLGNNLSIPRKEFLKRLREEYPKETRALSDRALTSMVEKMEGIIYKIGGKNHIGHFYGINWNDAPQQQDLGDNFYSSSNI